MSSEDDKLGFCAFVRSLDDSEGVSSTDLFRVFDRGEFYSVYGSNAEIIAETFFQSKESLKFIGSSSNPLATTHISKVRLGPVLTHILTTLRKAVNVYERPKGTPKDKHIWKITKKATAGDVSAFSDLISNAVSATTMFVSICASTDDDSKRMCHIAAVDTLSMRITAGSFIDSDVYSAFEACLAQMQPADVHLAVDSALGDEKAIAAMIGLTQANLRPFAPPSASPEAEALLQAAVDETDKAQLASACAHHPALVPVCFAVLLHLALLPPSPLPAFPHDYAPSPLASQRLQFRPLALDKYMKLDTAAAQALNLFPAPGDSDKSMSLYGLLNRTVTRMGARKLHEWVRLPLLDRAAIEQRLDIVGCFKDSAAALAAFRDALKSVVDVEMLCKRVAKRHAAVGQRAKAETSEHIIQDMVQLYQFAQRVPAVLAALDQLEGPAAAVVKAKYASTLGEARAEVEKYEEMVEATIDLKALDRHEFLVNASFNDDLTALDARRAKLRRAMDRVLPDMASDLNMDEKKIKLQRSGHHGHYFRVSRKDEKNLRSAKNVTTLETRKDGVKFTCSALKSLSDAYEEVMRDYDASQREVVVEALGIAAEYLPLFAALAEACAELDTLAALAVAAGTAYPAYVRPVLRDRGQGGVVLRDARHPCLEAQAGVSFIPNDIELIREKSHTQIITGPNMGGKSTYIRSLGVIAVMAQIGSFVPCTEAELPILDAVLARVGAGDSQLRGVSTFMKEMLEAAGILKTATEDSLVIVDELGRGTSTYDGFGLAWAIAEELALKTRCLTLFATHFHELTAIADGLSCVANRHVTAQTGENSITMLYKLQDGSCDRSFGIHVAELANFPPEVVKRAREKADELERFGDEASALVEPSAKRARTDIAALESFIEDIFAGDDKEVLLERGKLLGIADE